MGHPLYCLAARTQYFPSEANASTIVLATDVLYRLPKNLFCEGYGLKQAAEKGSFAFLLDRVKPVHRGSKRWPFSP